MNQCRTFVNFVAFIRKIKQQVQLAEGFSFEYGSVYYEEQQIEQTEFTELSLVCFLEDGREKVIRNTFGNRELIVGLQALLMLHQWGLGSLLDSALY